MAETSKNSAGEIAVDITGNTDPLKKKLAEMKSESEAAASQVESKVGAAAPAKQTEALGKAMNNLVTPVASVVSVFSRLLGMFSLITAAFGGLVAGFLAIKNALEAKKNAAHQAAETIKELGKQLDALQNKQITETFDPDAEANAIRKAYNERLDAELDLYNKQISAADKAGQTITAERLIRESAARRKEIEDEMKQRVDALYRFQDGMRNKRRSDDAMLAYERLEAERKVEETLREERRDSMRQLIDDYREVSDYYTRQQRDMMNAQREQFAQLRNDINGLFNTSGLEVGINRIGALIETLIQKTGDSR